MRFWDVPGKESFRGMWSNYLEEIEGLIYLVDVNREDIENSINILSTVCLLLRSISIKQNTPKIRSTNSYPYKQNRIQYLI